MLYNNFTKIEIGKADKNSEETNYNNNITIIITINNKTVNYI